jgi:hypothetical protein
MALADTLVAQFEHMVRRDGGALSLLGARRDPKLKVVVQLVS